GAEPGLFCIDESPSLLELALDARERSGQLRADAVHNADDHHRNAGRDEAVFDGGGTLLVADETNHIQHVQAPALRFRRSPPFDGSITGIAPGGENDVRWNGRICRSFAWDRQENFNCRRDRPTEKKRPRTSVGASSSRVRASYYFS